jgi:hypothetical protein
VKDVVKSLKDHLLLSQQTLPHTMKENYFQNDFAEFWTEENILFFIYKQGVRIDLNGAKQIVADRLKVQKNVPFPVFCDMRGIKDSDKPARDYLAKEGSSMVKAVAVLIDSPVTKIMLNFYLTISRPLIPTKMFTSKTDALDFVKSYSVQTTLS